MFVPGMLQRLLPHRDKPPQGERLVLRPMLAMLVHWYLYVWREPVRNSGETFLVKEDKHNARYEVHS